MIIQIAVSTICSNGARYHGTATYPIMKILWTIIIILHLLILTPAVVENFVEYV